MTLLTILGLTPRPGRITAGSVRYRGKEIIGLPASRMRSLRGRDIAMIFQDPMTTLNPVFRVGDQIRESLKVHGIYAGHPLFGGEKARRTHEQKRVLQLMDEVGIPSPEERYEAYPHEFSGGMQQRAVIAIALACNPSVLLADEPTTALDVTVQAQIMSLLERINEEHGTGIVLVTHDLSLAAEFCDRIAVMYAGQIVEEGDVDSIIDQPLHPYTRGLINAIPRPHLGKVPLEPIRGEIDLAELPEGCAFSPRCDSASESCRTAVPELYTLGADHMARCFRGAPPDAGSTRI
jgi:oligopeptide/dipeptide ABC transporter ATP-binding protein